MIKNQNVYVSVGGKGGDGKVLSRAYGGWNGGGDGESDQQDDEAMAGGGGCTSIQISLKSDGQLKNYASVKNTDVLIVAGGGGGGYTSNYGRDYLINQYGGGSVGAKAWYIILMEKTLNIQNRLPKPRVMPLVKDNQRQQLFLLIQRYLVAVVDGMGGILLSLL